MSESIISNFIVPEARSKHEQNRVSCKLKKVCFCDYQSSGILIILNVYVQEDGKGLLRSHLLSRCRSLDTQAFIHTSVNCTKNEVSVFL
jgi:hypothetical protein